MLNIVIVTFDTIIIILIILILLKRLRKHGDKRLLDAMRSDKLSEEKIVEIMGADEYERMTR